MPNFIKIILHISLMAYALANFANTETAEEHSVSSHQAQAPPLILGKKQSKIIIEYHNSNSALAKTKLPSDSVKIILSNSKPAQVGVPYSCTLSLRSSIVNHGIHNVTSDADWLKYDNLEQKIYGTPDKLGEVILTIKLGILGVESTTAITRTISVVNKKLSQSDASPEKVVDFLKKYFDITLIPQENMTNITVNEEQIYYESDMCLIELVESDGSYLLKMKDPENYIYELQPGDKDWKLVYNPILENVQSIVDSLFSHLQVPNGIDEVRRHPDINNYYYYSTPTGEEVTIIRKRGKFYLIIDADNSTTEKIEKPRQVDQE